MEAAIGPPEVVTDVVASPSVADKEPGAHPVPFADLPLSRQLQIGFTGGSLGDTDPCGCAHNPLGGLAKRVRWWQSVTDGRRNTLLLDVGGLMVPAVPNLVDRKGEAVARADVFLRAMAKAGYAALNVGTHELALGLSDLRRLAKARGIPLLSANIYGVDGKPAFETKLIRQVGSLRIGLMGLVTDRPTDAADVVLGQGLQLRPPLQAGAETVQALKNEGCDMIIVLSQMTRTEVDALMAQNADIDLVLGSTNMDLTTQLVANGGGYFADTYNKGKYAGLLTIAVRAPTGKRNRLYAANMRAALDAQRADVASQLQGLQSQLDESMRENSPVRMDAGVREIVGHQIAALRARLQRVTLELDESSTAPPESNAVDLEMAGMSQDLLDDPEVLKWIDKFKETYPKIPGR